jgi:hypothetical protein
MTVALQALIETLDDSPLARAAAEGSIRWWTTSPMIVEQLRADGEDVAWLDGELDCETSVALGLAARDAALALEPKIAAVAARLDWPELTPLITRRLATLLDLLAVKRWMLERFAAQPGRKVVVGDPNLGPTRNGEFALGRFETLFAALAEGTDVELVTRTAPDYAQLLKDIDRPVWTDRLLSQMDLSAGQRMWRRMRLVQGGIAAAEPDAPTVYIARDNELIRDILPALRRQGARIAMLPSPERVGEAGDPSAGVPGSAEIEAALEAALRAHGVSLSAEVVAGLVGPRLRAASAWWPVLAEAGARTVDAVFGDGSPAAILSNTINGLDLSAVTSAARRRGLPVAIAEHGVSAGLSQYHLPFRRWAEPAQGDIYLTCSGAAAGFFEDDPAHRARALLPVGLPGQTRSVPVRRMQRVIARARLRALPGRRVVVYLARAVQNNMRKLAYVPEDAALHELQRTIADRVMPKVRGVPVMKLYSTRRYVDGDPLQEGFRAPAPVRTLKAGDFRFLRAGADIILLESPLSTLGWALGTGKPLFFLADPAAPLLPEARAAMEAGLFLIDLAEPNWPETLVAAINRPDSHIKSDWAAKALARRDFLDRFVFGPADAGENAARALIDAIGVNQEGRAVRPAMAAQ